MRVIFFNSGTVMRTIKKFLKLTFQAKLIVFRAKWPQMMFDQQFLEFLTSLLFKFQGDKMCLKKGSKMTIMTLKGYVEKFLSILRSKSDSFEIFLISEILTILK